MGSVTLPVAFALGIASFASPCVVPLVPVYLANIAGLSVLGDTPPSRRHIIVSTLLFVAGFSLVFILMGTALNALMGGITMVVKQRIAGALLVVFGVFLYAATKIPQLTFQRRLGLNRAHGTGYVRSFALGAIFSIGWTPCIGPIIGGVLAMAAFGGNALAAVAPLTAYSLGLGVPFLIMAALLGTAAGSRLMRWMNQRAHVATAIGSITLVVVGVLMFTGVI
ncbi:MAG: cytochrome c biogenesis protein CcdA [Dehalococcoidia bacterium]|jgi:cytochrome c-type biogenesis protein|nr:cytochrome c biogenesis protein CcdA [Dehalococcoidia bacterium]